MKITLVFKAEPGSNYSQYRMVKDVTEAEGSDPFPGKSKGDGLELSTDSDRRFKPFDFIRGKLLEKVIFRPQKSPTKQSVASVKIDVEFSRVGVIPLGNTKELDLNPCATVGNGWTLYRDGRPEEVKK